MQHDTSDITAICSDPNALVALVNATPSVWVPVDRCAQTRFTHTLKPLILQAADAPIRDIMDALAGLSLNEENTSIACGLRVDDRGAIEIIIASGNNIAETTQKHIRRVWTKMVEISALSRSPRPGDGLRGSQQARDLVRSLYEYCMPSFSVKFLEAFAGLRDRVAEYHELHEREAAKPSPFWRLRMDELRVIVKRIENISKDLEPYEQAISTSFTSPTEPTLDTFIPTIDSVMEGVNSVLEIGQSTNPYVETWNPLLILGGWVNNLCRGALRHLLEDLISFPANIERIRTFWSTRRFAQMANFKLHIRTLNDKTYGAPLGPWPSNPHDWKKVYEHFPLKRGYRFVGTEDAHDFSHTPTDPSELVVHPELKIATYLHILSHILAENESSSNSTPPFNYISVSNLSCLPCARWMSKLNSMDLKHGVAFRGSTSKWPNDWRMPALKAAEISGDIEYWAWEDYLRAQSRESVVNVIDEKDPTDWP